jgi:hypothetical protein
MRKRSVDIQRAYTSYIINAVTVGKAELLRQKFRIGTLTGFVLVKICKSRENEYEMTNCLMLGPSLSTSLIRKLVLFRAKMKMCLGDARSFVLNTLQRCGEFIHFRSEFNYCYIQRWHFNRSLWIIHNCGLGELKFISVAPKEIGYGYIADRRGFTVETVAINQS